MYIGDIFLGKKQTGNNQCYYCGAACGDTYSIDEYVKDTFTNFEFVKKQDSKPSYNYDWYCKIKEWHAINDKPRGNRGLFISCDGIMSVESHRKQVELTCGGLEVLKKYE